MKATLEHGIGHFASEFVKDSPLLLYFLFYHTFHEWLVTVANEWNPILKFFLNILMVSYALFRLIAILKDIYRNKKK